MIKEIKSNRKFLIGNSVSLTDKAPKQILELYNRSDLFTIISYNNCGIYTLEDSLGFTFNIQSNFLIKETHSNLDNEYTHISTISFNKFKSLDTVKVIKTDYPKTLSYLKDINSNLKLLRQNDHTWIAIDSNNKKYYIPGKYLELV